MNALKKCQKMPKSYDCECCHFKCSKMSNYNKHLQTDKHMRLINPNFSYEKNAENTRYSCICGKSYKHMSSLCCHKKECVQLNNNKDTNDVAKLTNLILQVVQSNTEIVKSNNELQKQVIELSKEKTNTYIQSNHNSHNKTFNLNIFLNDTCKDAMNIMDFADSLKIKISDLENVGKLGYIDGITNIIIKNLQELDITKRPVHCSDVKREILYIKDKNVWGKEKERLKDAIKHVAHKNVQMIPKWKEENPAYCHDEGRANDEYLKIIMQSMGGSDKQEDDVYQNKIISKLAKHVIIEKSNDLQKEILY